MKLLYKPFALVASFIAARLGRNAFKAMWSHIDQEAPPEPTTEETTLQKVLGAAVLEAAIMAGVAAAADRASARTFHYLTGFWPGKKRPAEAEEE